MTATTFFAASMTALLQNRPLRASGSMLQRQTTMVDTLQAESIAITSAFVLLFFVCGVALLQSRLIKAAGHWQQHRASMIQPRNHTLRQWAFWLQVEVTRLFAPSPYCIMHSSNELSEQSSPSAGATEHCWSATIIEDVLENIIPFLTMEGPAFTMCDHKPGRTFCLQDGRHMHVWCHTCANLPFEYHCTATYETCQGCQILRTIIQLSRRWDEFMWERYTEME